MSLILVLDLMRRDEENARVIIVHRMHHVSHWGAEYVQRVLNIKFDSKYLPLIDFSLRFMKR
jgi:hypothetical protein